jgi:hypothetical protein
MEKVEPRWGWLKLLEDDLISMLPQLPAAQYQEAVIVSRSE